MGWGGGGSKLRSCPLKSRVFYALLYRAHLQYIFKMAAGQNVVNLTIALHNWCTSSVDRALDFKLQIFIIVIFIHFHSSFIYFNMYSFLHFCKFPYLKMHYLLICFLFKDENLQQWKKSMNNVKKIIIMKVWVWSPGTSIHWWGLLRYFFLALFKRNRNVVVWPQFGGGLIKGYVGISVEKWSCGPPFVFHSSLFHFENNLKVSIPKRFKEFQCENN